MAAFAAGCCPGNGEGEDKEEPFDPGPIDSHDEPDLFPPDPHNKWVHLKREALLAGDLEMADKIMAPVICHGSKQHNPGWEPLSFQEVKEFWQTVTEHGMGPLYSAASPKGACQEPRLWLLLLLCCCCCSAAGAGVQPPIWC